MKPNPLTIQVHLSDLEWWVKTTTRPAFAEALKRAKDKQKITGQVIILWHSDLTFEIK